jgi:hypothetical protein
MVLKAAYKNHTLIMPFTIAEKRVLRAIKLKTFVTSNIMAMIGDASIMVTLISSANVP